MTANEVLSKSFDPRDRVIPYDPPHLTPQELDLYNRIFRSRVRFEGKLEGLTFNLSLSANPTAVYSLTGSTVIGLNAGLAKLAMRFPQSHIVAIAQAVQPTLKADLDPALLELLLELAMTPLLERLELSLGTPIEVEYGADCNFIGQRRYQMQFMVKIGEDFAAVPVFLNSQALALLAELADLAPPDTRPTLADFLIPVSLRVGRTKLTLAQLASVKPGDVALLDLNLVAKQQVAAVISDQFGAHADVQASKAKFRGPFRLLKANSEEFPLMQDEGTGYPHSHDDAQLESLQVNLVFELGTKTIALRELRDMTSGSVITLDRNAGDPIDILSGGQKIGRGTIVRIGDVLGVRIVRLFGHE